MLSSLQYKRFIGVDMLFFVFACSTALKSQEDPASLYYEKFSDYQTWEQAEDWIGVQPSQSVHGTFVQIWWNNSAKEAILDGTDIPAGAALMKEGYNDEEGNEFIALTLMVKQDGFAPDNNNWFWASYDAAGNVNQSGGVEMCISCHATSDSDYVLFVEEE